MQFLSEGHSLVFAAALFLALLVPLVVIHELGHFLAAKAFGIKVLEFGVGFRPRAHAWRLGETEYSLNWLPLGGFVRLLGEDDPSAARSLAAAPAWKRLIVLYAGVVMNVALAVTLLTASFMIPRERSLSMAQVVDVVPGSPAAQARIEGEMRDGRAPAQGLQPGDIIIEVEGREIRNTSELVLANRLHLGETQVWVLVRQNSTLTAHVYARWHPPSGEGPTGLGVAAPLVCASVDADGQPANCDLQFPATESVWYLPWDAVPKALQSMKDILIFNVNAVRVRVGGGGGTVEGEPFVQGPVGLANTTREVVDSFGWRPLIDVAAMLSLSLGIFNALPIPVLDGGRALFVFIEVVRRGRRIAPKKESLAHLVGFVSLIALVLFITVFDIRRLLS